MLFLQSSSALLCLSCIGCWVRDSAPSSYILNGALCSTLPWFYSALCSTLPWLMIYSALCCTLLHSTLQLGIPGGNMAVYRVTYHNVYLAADNINTRAL